MPKYNITEKKTKNPLYRTALSPQVVERLYERIMERFVVGKKYRDSDYSAQKLAAELETNARYVSAVINLRYQDNYSQMVNEFRIKDAMYMLKDPHFSSLTVEDVALKAGFANRQSFYAAFYKRVGLTPCDYRRETADKLRALMKERRLKERESRRAKAAAAQKEGADQ